MFLCLHCDHVAICVEPTARLFVITVACVLLYSHMSATLSATDSVSVRVTPSDHLTAVLQVCVSESVPL